MKQKDIGYHIIGKVLMVFIILICLFPLAWVFFSSFKSNIQILNSAFSLPEKLSLKGYKMAIEITALHKRFFTSIIISSSSTAIAVFIFSMSAYVLARMQFSIKNILFSLFICTILIPTNAMVQPIYTVIKFLGLYDTKLALILVYSAFGMPMCLFLMRSFFLSIPDELEESSTIEGANFFQIFWYIMIPCAKPVMASAAVLTFVNSWNELMYALLLTSSEKNRTMPLAIKYFTSMFSFNYSAMFAALIMSVLPTILIYIVLQEQIMESIIVGSVKG